MRARRPEPRDTTTKSDTAPDALRPITHAMSAMESVAIREIRVPFAMARRPPPQFDATPRDLDISDNDVLISAAMLTRSAEYAVRALSLLSLQEGEGALHSADIAAELGLPPQFLTKILRRLTATDLVSSQRGRTGGFRLNRAADEISLLAVVRPFQDGLSGVECLLGQRDCTDPDSCPLHEPWAQIRRSFHDLLAETTLADVANRAVRNTTPHSGLAESGEAGG